MNHAVNHPSPKRHAAPSPRPPAAAGARAQAQRLLGAVFAQRLTLDEAVAKHPLTGAPADQRFTMRLVLTVLQHLGQVDAVLARYLEKPLPAKRHEVMNALRLGAVQLLLLHTPAHAAINETVMLLKKGKDAGFAALVNALLQKIAREQPALAAPESNLPSWLRTRWEAAYGAAAVAAMAQVAAQRAPLDIQCAQPMEGAVRLNAQMLRFVGEHPPVEQLPGYATGAFFVQDVAASYPVRMAGDLRERQVLDVCAAPGGKAMQLIQAGAFVTALDRSAVRMKRLKANLARMGMQANTVVADALEWQPRRAYDVILLDAPCTATGTWRRHPEVVHLMTPEAIAEMVALQRALLARAWGWLKPGGRIVYCVCSLEPEEGEQQAAWFAATQADAQRVAVEAVAGDIPAACLTPEGALRTRPDLLAEQGGMDGFFAVCFTRAFSG